MKLHLGGLFVFVGACIILFIDYEMSIWLLLAAILICVMWEEE